MERMKMPHLLGKREASSPAEIGRATEATIAEQRLLSVLAKVKVPLRVIEYVLASDTKNGLSPAAKSDYRKALKALQGKGLAQVARDGSILLTEKGRSLASEPEGQRLYQILLMSIHQDSGDQPSNQTPQ
jgi:hypothetical protein